MNVKSNKKVRPGVALLVVLFIVMTITILSLGFVARSDVELACGQNMLIRTKMDYLAESGLEHARGLILNPQDVVGAGYWGGDTNLQLTSGSDYYDVAVTRDASDFCDYTIDCNSYRLEGTERMGLSRLRAELRVDPCIAYWVGVSTTVSSATIINGDVYCDGKLTNNGTIDGDAFATNKISGTIAGRKNESVTTEYPVAWPNIAIGTTYYIGATAYPAEVIDSNQPLGPSIPTGANPAGICYSGSDVDMPGNVTINGTLVVTGNLVVSGASNIITAEPNFPALLVGGQVVMKDNSSLVINGLAQIEQQITDDPSTISANIDVTGGLFIRNGDITSDKINVSITAEPATASIEIWSAGNTSTRWSPAAGAFFRSIERR